MKERERGVDRERKIERKRVRKTKERQRQTDRQTASLNSPQQHSLGLSSRPRRECEESWVFLPGSYALLPPRRSSLLV